MTHVNGLSRPVYWAVTGEKSSKPAQSTGSTGSTDPARIRASRHNKAITQHKCASHVMTRPVTSVDPVDCAGYTPFTPVDRQLIYIKSPLI